MGPPVKDPVKFIVRAPVFCRLCSALTCLQKNALDMLAKPDAIDDRTGFFVDLLSALCKLPQDSALAQKANDRVIELLYDSLPHPPATYVGADPSTATPWTLSGAAPSANPPTAASSSAASWPAGGPTADPDGIPSVPPPQSASAPSGPAPPTPRTPWAFRAADGRGNNAWLPALGQSGRPYARDVEGKQPLPANVLPDAGLVFDTLLKSQGDVRAPSFCSFLPSQAYYRIVERSSSRTRAGTAR